MSLDGDGWLKSEKTVFRSAWEKMLSLAADNLLNPELGEAAGGWWGDFMAR